MRSFAGSLVLLALLGPVAGCDGGGTAKPAASTAASEDIGEVIATVNGVQIGAASFLFSIMALPRHIDRLPPESENTGITDT